MQTLTVVAQALGFSTRPISLRQLLAKLGVNTARDAVAAHRLDDYYRRNFGSAGRLGSPREPMRRNPDGSYTRTFALGRLNLDSSRASPSDQSLEPVRLREATKATVQLAAVKCFGTDDPGGTDEPFVVVSVVSVDPNQLAGHQNAITARTEIVNGISSGNVFLDDGRMLTSSPIDVTGTGLHIGVAVYDHDLGDPDKIKDTIAQAVSDAAQQAAQIIANAAAADDPTLNGPIGDLAEFSVLGVKPLKVLTDAVVDALYLLGRQRLGSGPGS